MQIGKRAVGAEIWLHRMRNMSPTWPLFVLPCDEVDREFIFLLIVDYVFGIFSIRALPFGGQKFLFLWPRATLRYGSVWQKCVVAVVFLVYTSLILYM
jgi:hypothetical protein